MQKVFNTGKGTALTLGVQILNLLNEDAVEYWSTWNINELSDGTLQDYTASNWINPRRAQVRIKFAF